MKKRLFYFLLDGFGCGETEDACEFGDSGSNTSLHVLEANTFLKQSYLYSIGLFDCKKKKSYLYPTNSNKDTFSCTSEMFGTLLQRFKTFPNGFPSEIIQYIENTFQLSLIGNKVVSGTEIIHDIGELSCSKGSPIIYTSADSVMQFAAHIDTFPISRLYYMCEIVRRVFCPILPLGRVIARPFAGNNSEDFYRTSDRKDFSYPLPSNAMIDEIQNSGVKVFGNRIFREIFPLNFLEPINGKGNRELYTYFQNIIKTSHETNELYLINLEDFDMLYGHRRNVIGYGKELKVFSDILESSIPFLADTDAIVISADHGNDPCFKLHTDHTREFSPYLFLTNDGASFIDEPKPISYIGSKIKSFFGLDDG
ncbi:MAG: phosphopentomutase [Caldisericia bacterium]|nr:phosphopentomutase [Caldisericia bacterium]